MGVDLHESTRIDLDTRRRQIQALGVGHPPHRHHHDRSLSTVSCAVLREIHPNATRRRIKRLHTTEALAHHHARFAEGGRDRRGHVVVLAGQDPRAALEQLHFRAEGVEDRGDLRPGRPPPTTNIDCGTAVRAQASLWVAVNSNPGTSSRLLVPPPHRMNLSA